MAETVGTAEMVGMAERSGRRDAAPARRCGDGARRRFNPGHAHRQAVMASLPPEQQPIAEQVLRGGIPAVRTALHLEREKAVAEGRPAPNTDQLIAMAESLLPRLKAAEWRDRAEAAAKDVDEISLRDLRSVVAGADVARDDESRALAATLARGPGPAGGRIAPGSGPRRSPSIWTRTGWCGPCAWRPARPSRPPAWTRSSPNGSATPPGKPWAPDTPPDRWLALIDAVAASPVRPVGETGRACRAIPRPSCGGRPTSSRGGFRRWRPCSALPSPPCRRRRRPAAAGRRGPAARLPGGPGRRRLADRRVHRVGAGR